MVYLKNIHLFHPINHFSIILNIFNQFVHNYIHHIHVSYFDIFIQYIYLDLYIDIVLIDMMYYLYLNFLKMYHHFEDEK